MEQENSMSMSLQTPIAESRGAKLMFILHSSINEGPLSKFYQVPEKPIVPFLPGILSIQAGRVDVTDGDTKPTIDIKVIIFLRYF